MMTKSAGRASRSRVRVRLLLEHERPRFDQLIEEQHYLHTSVLLGHPPGA